MNIIPTVIHIHILHCNDQSVGWNIQDQLGPVVHASRIREFCGLTNSKDNQQSYGDQPKSQKGEFGNVTDGF